MHLYSVDFLHSHEFDSHRIELNRSRFQYVGKSQRCIGKSRKNMWSVWSCRECTTNWRWTERTNAKTNPKADAYQMERRDWMVKSTAMYPYCRCKCYRWQSLVQQQTTTDCSKCSTNKISWICDIFARSIDKFWWFWCDHLEVPESKDEARRRKSVGKLRNKTVTLTMCCLVNNGL